MQHIALLKFSNISMLSECPDFGVSRKVQLQDFQFCLLNNWEMISETFFSFCTSYLFLSLDLFIYLFNPNARSNRAGGEKCCVEITFRCNLEEVAIHTYGNAW